MAYKKRKKQKKSLWSTFWKTLLAFILAYIVSYAVVINIDSKAAIQIFGYRGYLVSDTGSMEPNLKHNDLVYVTAVPMDELEVKDVVVFERVVKIKGKDKIIPVIHRVRNILPYADGVAGEIALETQGDALNSPDNKMTTIDGKNGTNRYIGKVTGHNDFIRFLGGYLTSIYGAMNIVVIAVLLGILYIYSRETDEERRERLWRAKIERWRNSKD